MGGKGGFTFLLVQTFLVNTSYLNSSITMKHTNKNKMINESQSPKDEAQLALISSRGAIKLKRIERVKKSIPTRNTVLRPTVIYINSVFDPF